MTFGAGKARLAQALGKLDRSFLIGAAFRVAEGEIEEELQIWRSLEIVTRVDGGPGNPERQRVGLVHARCAAKGIARELIEENEQRQRLFRRRRPLKKFAARSRLVGSEEAFAKRAIEFGVLGKPACRPGLAPESDYSSRLVRRRKGFAQPRVEGWVGRGRGAALRLGWLKTAQRQGFDIPAEVVHIFLRLSCGEAASPRPLQREIRRCRY